MCGYCRLIAQLVERWREIPEVCGSSPHQSVVFVVMAEWQTRRIQNSVLRSEGSSPSTRIKTKKGW